MGLGLIIDDWTTIAASAVCHRILTTFWHALHFEDV
jgi:hypothetical protein